MLSAYHTHISERSAVGLPPLPLNAEQVAAFVELLKVTPASASDATELVDLLENRIPAGVDQAAYVKAAFLADIAKGTAKSALVSSTFNSFDQNLSNSILLPLTEKSQLIKSFLIFKICSSVNLVFFFKRTESKTLSS